MKWSWFRWNLIGIVGSWVLCWIVLVSCWSFCSRFRGFEEKFGILGWCWGCACLRKEGKIRTFEFRFVLLFFFFPPNVLLIFLLLIGMGFCWDRWRFPAFSDQPNRELKWVDFVGNLKFLIWKCFPLVFVYCDVVGSLVDPLQKAKKNVEFPDCSCSFQLKLSQIPFFCVCACW